MKSLKLKTTYDCKEKRNFILQSEMKLFVLFCRFTRTRLADEVVEAAAAARQLLPTRRARLPQVDRAIPTSLQQE
jgi:hypothetical protein